jgi:hypothetical protein
MPRVERGHPVTIRLEDGSELGTMTWVGRLAAIGEAVQFGQERYRVVDVLWKSEHLLASSLSAGNRIAMVTLTVRREA